MTSSDRSDHGRNRQRGSRPSDGGARIYELRPGILQGSHPPRPAPGELEWALMLLTDDSPGPLLTVREQR
ncbi:MAG TPA: hypothetical protein VF520_11955 [Thermoleophilaceae bacterium]